MVVIDPVIDFVPGLGPALLRVPGLPLVAQVALVGATATLALAGALALGTRRRARSRL
jgi:hypothetical protein